MAGGAGLVRFVHTADLHLDRPFSGLHGLTSRVEDAVLEASFNAFENIIEFTIHQQADALLIAGDIYDGADRSLRAQRALIEGLDRLDQCGIRTFICHGNHDSLDDWTARLRFPPLVHRFGPEIEAVALDTDPQVEVIGVSQPHTMPVDGIVNAFEDARNAAFSVGLFYGNVTDSLNAFEKSSLGCWALGKLHRQAVFREQRPAVLYPGTPQGHTPLDIGPGGAYVIDIDRNGRVAWEFHALDAIRWLNMDIQTAAINTKDKLLSTIEERIERELVAAGRPIIYRIICSDPRSPDLTLESARSIAEIVARLNDEYGNRSVFAWCHEMVCKPVLPTSSASRSQAGDAIAALINLSDELRSRPDARLQIDSELATLFDNERLKPYLAEAGVSDDDLAEIIVEAESRVLAALGIRD